MAVMVTDLLAERARFDAIPWDGVRREFISGEIIVSPSPGASHQRMVVNLAYLLLGLRPDPHWGVLTGPFDVFLAADVLVPDVLVAQWADIHSDGIHGPPSLVVEVRSPSTGRRDETVKRGIYERAGVPSYWLADPDVPSITVLELREGRYVEVGRAVGDQTIAVSAPFPVELNPAQLAA